MTVEAFAPAKVNLTLHVTGRRPDGYHELDSLACFVGVGDRIAARDADRLSLTITGPMAGRLRKEDDNLVLRAARLLAPGRGAEITLEKHLPVAAGVGGGSTDAAAALRALSDLWGVPTPPASELTALGADVPVCLTARPMRMRGIGERLDPLPPLPKVGIVLANAGVAVPTAAVFSELAPRGNPPMPRIIPPFGDADSLCGWLSGQRNDLESAARRIAPAVTDTLQGLSALDGCGLVRMSGSGAACFGLFRTPAEARTPAEVPRTERPGWWVAASTVASSGCRRHPIRSSRAANFRDWGFAGPRSSDSARQKEARMNTGRFVTPAALRDPPTFILLRSSSCASIAVMTTLGGFPAPEVFSVLVMKGVLRRMADEGGHVECPAQSVLSARDVLLAPPLAGLPDAGSGGGSRIARKPVGS